MVDTRRSKTDSSTESCGEKDAGKKNPVAKKNNPKPIKNPTAKPKKKPVPKKNPNPKKKNPPKKNPNPRKSKNQESPIGVEAKKAKSSGEELKEDEKLEEKAEMENSEEIPNPSSGVEEKEGETAEETVDTEQSPVVTNPNEDVENPGTKDSEEDGESSGKGETEEEEEDGDGENQKEDTDASEEEEANGEANVESDEENSEQNEVDEANVANWEESEAEENEAAHGDGDGGLSRQETVGERIGDGGSASREEGLGVETTPLRPLGMYFKNTEYGKTIKLSTRCFIRRFLKKFDKMKLTRQESSWWEKNEQFCHFFHMPRKGNHMVQTMLMLLLRTAKIEKKKEVWFVLNGVPIRYGLREHALLSGLDCANYPLNWRHRGSLDYVNRQFPEGRVTMERVEKKLGEMEGDTKGERLKMMVLYFLCSIVYSPARQGKDGATAVHDIFLRYVDDLTLVRRFPWGRFSYDMVLESIKATMSRFKGVVDGDWPFPGFCVPLEILATEAVPELKEKFRVANPDACSECPRMCQFNWKSGGMKGYPLDVIYGALDKTDSIQSLLLTEGDEDDLLDAIVEEDENPDVHDPIVESWMKTLKEGRHVVFEEMMVEDLEGRVIETAVSKPVIGNRKRKSAKSELGQLVDAVKDVGDLMREVVDKQDKLEKRMEALEGFMKNV